MPELSGANQPESKEQQNALDAVLQPLKVGQATPDQGAIAKKSSRESASTADNAKPQKTVDEIVAVWFKETRQYQPPMENQHPMDWVQSQLPKLVAALTRR